jgi:glutaminase
MDDRQQAPFRSPFVSTGALPSPDTVQELVEEAHRRFRPNTEGANSQVYPALAEVRSDLFGVCVAGVTGRLYEAGDTEVSFPIMSVSKPFVFALACQALGADAVRERVGVNATGLPFNSVTAVESSGDGRTNPMVNPGAIATTSLIPGAGLEDRWRVIHKGLSGFAARPLALDEDVYRSASETNYRNRSLVDLLAAFGRVYCDPEAALDLYTRQSSLSVTARDLAVMGATLADGGVNPLTSVRVIDQNLCGPVLAAMTVAGLYETSGDWLFDVGLPGKSGIGGGIVTVSPGKGALGTFAPLLDEAGNSVKGRLVAGFLSRALGLDILQSRPAGPAEQGPGGSDQVS